MNDKGFFGALFDFSFSSYVTTRLIRFLYALAVLGVGVGAFAILLGGLAGDGAVNLIGAIILAPIVFVVGVLLARVYMELLVVIFAIAENTTAIRKQLAADGDDAPPIS